VQLTSTPGAQQSARDGGLGSWSWTNSPVTAAVIAFLGWLGYVLARYVVWAKGHLSAFVVAGYGPYGHTHWGQLPHGLFIGYTNKTGYAGYDGQFYYRLALNPFNWSKTAYGITMDQNYRYTRIGYPFLTWLISFGQHNLVPFALVAVNLLGVAAMAYFGAMFARDSGRHALWGLMFAAYFGLAISVGRDTAEPLAEALMLAGLLAYRRDRWLWSAAAFAYGAITRETILFAPAGIAVYRLISFVRRKARPGLPDLCWLVPAAAYGCMQVLGKLVVGGQSGIAADSGRNLSAPFTPMLRSIRQAIAALSVNYLGVADIALLEWATLAVFIVAGLAVILVTTAPVHERIAFVFFVLEVCLASDQIWQKLSPGGNFGDGRSFIEPFLLALILLLATPKRYLNRYQLAAILAAALPALAVVVRRRILYM
jgi:hypothetical protein